MDVALVLTCEHGGNDVPAQYRELFDSRAAERALAGHRGLDIGSLAVAEALSARLGVPLICATVTRLLVDLNRSLRHPRLFSEFSRALDETQRQKVLAEHYRPYRESVTQAVTELVQAGRLVLHVSVHSFTPRLGTRRRTTDIGLLYDPARPPERELCAAWKAELTALAGGLRIRRNDPYRGKADGLTTHLRRVFPASAYLGIELELNQRFLPGRAERIAETVAASLTKVLERGATGRPGSGLRRRRKKR